MDINTATTQLARLALTKFLEGKHENFSLPADVPAELLEKSAGVVVSLYDEKQELRGRIGTYEPTQPNIALEIIANAVSAGTKDARYKPLKLEELNKCSFVVDILSKLEKIESLSELDPVQYGIYLEKNDQRGLVLPELEGMDTTSKQLNLALQRAGLEDFYGVDIYRFTTVRCFEKIR
jgi:AMMECR1 domain-containing protein